MRKLFLFLSLLVALMANAQQKQKFSVTSFEIDQFDLTAKNEQYRKIDGNGSLYAIIKVTSSNPDDDLTAYRFNFGNMNHEVMQKENKLWVYVQRNAKYVTISRQGYVTVERYNLQTTIEEGRTYVMQLSVTAAPVYTQMVQFAVEPSSTMAVVMVKGSKQDTYEELFGNTDNTGSVAKNLPLGTYTYRVMAENYHTIEGRFTLTDRKTTHVEKVVLRPNFSEVTLQVEADADIYVNDEKKGQRSWRGILKAGNYHVECRQTNHRNSSQYITIVENDNRIFTLTPPTPITGILAITSRPLGASIMIDGKNYGVTPQNIDGLVVGHHTVMLSKANYKTESQAFEVKENQTTDLNVTLNDISMMTIKSRPSNSTLYIDGKNVGTTPYTAEMGSGDYNIRITNPKYHVFSKRVHLDSSHPEITLHLDKQYLNPNAFYLQTGMQVGTFMGYGLNAGGYLSNFNMEAFITFSTEEEEVSNDYLKGMFFGIKIGYGLLLGSRLRIAPQVGVGQLQIKGDREASDSYCGTIGGRFEYAFADHFGISLTPEVQFELNKDENFEELSSASSKIKGWGTGANLRVGVYIYF